MSINTQSAAIENAERILVRMGRPASIQWNETGKVYFCYSPDRFIPVAEAGPAPAAGQMLAQQLADGLNLDVPVNSTGRQASGWHKVPMLLLSAELSSMTPAAWAEVCRVVSMSGSAALRGMNVVLHEEAQIATLLLNLPADDVSIRDVQQFYQDARELMQKLSQASPVMEISGAFGRSDRPRLCHVWRMAGDACRFTLHDARG